MLYSKSTTSTIKIIPHKKIERLSKKISKDTIKYLTKRIHIELKRSNNYRNIHENNFNDMMARIMGEILSHTFKLE